jgi:RNA polymerase sigma-70 factor (ECF subfamily)
MFYFYLSMLETENEKQTFAQIYEETRHACYHVAVSITKNAAMAEDAVHNAFLSVIENKEKIFSMPCGKRKSLIVIITKHKAIDLTRKKDNQFSSEEIEIADDFDLCDIFESQEGYAYLINCIKTLPEKYKTVFYLRYVKDMNNMEIAALLGITNKAVSTRLARAKQMLREMVNGVKNGQPTSE